MALTSEVPPRPPHVTYEIHEVTELRISVPETGRLLLPLPLAATGGARASSAASEADRAPLGDGVDSAPSPEPPSEELHQGTGSQASLGKAAPGVSDPEELLRRWDGQMLVWHRTVVSGVVPR